VINLEDRASAVSAETDRSTLFARRLAEAIARGAIARCHQAGCRFAALAEFARAINESLDPREAFPPSCAIPNVLPSDIVV
jgi:hypothetical protein